jgi:hypothetical protein
MALERNPYRLEEVFNLRLRQIYLRAKTPEERSTMHGNLLAEIDTSIAQSHIEGDHDALAAWESARDFVRREIK